MDTRRPLYFPGCVVRIVRTMSHANFSTSVKIRGVELDGRTIELYDRAPCRATVVLVVGSGYSYFGVGSGLGLANSAL